MTTKKKLIFEIERRMEMYKDKEKDGRKHKDFFWEGYFMGAGKALASLLRYVESIMED